MAPLCFESSCLIRGRVTSLFVRRARAPDRPPVRPDTSRAAVLADSATALSPRSREGTRSVVMPRRAGRASFRKVRITPDETAAIRRAEEGEREEEA